MDNKDPMGMSDEFNARILDPNKPKFTPEGDVACTVCGEGTAGMMMVTVLNPKVFGRYGDILGTSGLLRVYFLGEGCGMAMQIHEMLRVHPPLAVSASGLSPEEARARLNEAYANGSQPAQDFLRDFETAIAEARESMAEALDAYDRDNGEDPIRKLLGRMATEFPPAEA